MNEARILRPTEVGDRYELVTLPARPVPRARPEPAQVVQAADRARAIVEQAEERARALLLEAERQAAEGRLRIETEARADAAAAVAAQAIALRASEARADERQLDRVVDLARLLAERLLGQALSLEPELVTALARQALGEARGARRATIVAHPDDVASLASVTAGLDLEEAVRLVSDASRARGSLRVETDVGVLDAEIAPQLDRLARRLRETLSR